MKHLARPLLVGLIVAAYPLLSPALEVRTAAQDSQPKFVKIGNAMSGLCIDIFKALERIDTDLKFTQLNDFTPLPRIEASLEEGRLDAFCGLAKTEKRKAKLDFIETPIYSTHTVLAARIDDKADIKSFDDLRKLGDDATVLVVYKTVQADTLAAQPGLKVDGGAKDTSTNLKKLIEGRGRFILQNDFALIDEIKRDNLGDKIKILPAHFDSGDVERYIVISKTANPALRTKLVAAVEKLNTSGDLAKIFQPYKPK